MAGAAEAEVAKGRGNGAGDPVLRQTRAMQELFEPMVGEFLEAKLPAITQEMLQHADTVLTNRLSKLPPQEVHILNGEKIISKLSRQHYLLPTVLKLLTTADRYGNNLNIALVGPTGTGKTKMCLNAAKALNQDFILLPFNPQTTKSDLVGYMAANGQYVESPFYKAFKQGRLFIADEFDTANPAVATILNAAISNRVLTFPNGESVEAHKNFRAVFCMNTYGLGGDDRYTGRTRLDMATLDRMVFVHVPIDPGLEAALIGVVDKESPKIDLEEGGRFSDARAILHEIVTLRGALESGRMRYSISPRAAIHAEALHRAGFGKRWIERSCIFGPIPEADQNKLMKEARLN